MTTTLSRPVKSENVRLYDVEGCGVIGRDNAVFIQHSDKLANPEMSTATVEFNLSDDDFDSVSGFMAGDLFPGCKLFTIEQKPRILTVQHGGNVCTFGKSTLERIILDIAIGIVEVDFAKASNRSLMQFELKQFCVYFVFMRNALSIYRRQTLSHIIQYIAFGEIRHVG